MFNELYISTLIKQQLKQIIIQLTSYTIRPAADQIQTTNGPQRNTRRYVLIKFKLILPHR